MQDWIDKLHGFLDINSRSILQGSGSIRHEEMLEKVEKEYSVHKNAQKKLDKIDFSISPDFDNIIEKIGGKK